ncbi:hypothetical protein O1611_g5042 [Lasiodiplodia mahajangana]|uniref:Uncharacterized protein n=1 Tax=Lasiodiplodia mahajangana TaxID=1108764 RepID=A0ACC2JMW9_9PEZI|nr:hypothetical protein O1611_g5042 [Lasiodiplodia mahajangana]
MGCLKFRRKRIVPTLPDSQASPFPRRMSNSGPAAGAQITHPRKYGLNQVYPDPSISAQSEEPSIDIIAVHGQGTGSPEAWVARRIDGDPNSGDVHWLKDKDMLPSKVPNSRIFTYDWDASLGPDMAIDSMLGHADLLLAILDIKTEPAKRPIIWVASGFGGLLVAKALQRASEGNSRYHDILHSTIGAVFLGTPFRGSENSLYSAADLRLAIALSTGAEFGGELVGYCRGLDDIVPRFTQMVSHDGFKFPIVCFYETQKTCVGTLVRNKSDIPEGFRLTLEGNWAVLVGRYSASLQGIEALPLDVRHDMLSKFTHCEDPSFKSVANRIKGFADNAGNMLAAKR